MPQNECNESFKILLKALKVTSTRKIITRTDGVRFDLSKYFIQIALTVTLISLFIRGQKSVLHLFHLKNSFLQENNSKAVLGQEEISKNLPCPILYVYTIKTKAVFGVFMKTRYRTS